MKTSKLVLSILLGLYAAGDATADTSFLGGELKTAASWSDGLPAGQTATIDVDGYIDPRMGFGDTWLSGSTVTIGGGCTLSLDAVGNSDWASAGAVLVTVNDATINCSDDFLITNSAVVFNAGSTTSCNDLWQTRDSARVTINGGTHVSNNVFGARQGASGGGVAILGGTVTAGSYSFEANTVNSIGGGAVLQSGSAATALAMNGSMDFLSNWTGSWEVGSFVDGDWESALTGGGYTLDGVPINASIFAGAFVVTDDTTLSLNSSTGPTSFNGGEMLVAANWTNGLPVGATLGTAAADGTFTDSAGVADWNLKVTGGTITASQDWRFTGNSRITVDDGTMDVAGDILSGDESTMTFNGGTVSWGGSFEPSGSPGGTIAINGGTFTGTAAAGTTFGNVAGGGVIVAGGTITASNFDFSDGGFDPTTIGGGAVLVGDSATFGWCDIRPDWTGSFTLTGFSGTDWESEFTSGNITLDGATLDAAAFALDFTVTPDGQTLTYTPNMETAFLGGELKTAANWDNGLPDGMVATIEKDGHIDPRMGFGDTWLSGSTVTIGGGCTLSLDTVPDTDWASVGAVLVTVNDATINCSDDFLISNSVVVFNAGSTTSCNDLWQARDSARVTINGGTHVSNSVFGAREGASGGGVAILGGTVTAAGSYDFQANTVNSIGGAAVLQSGSAATTLTMNGAMDLLSGWTGSWTVASFGGYDWENALTTNNGFTLDGNPIDSAAFNANFAVTNHGQTLQRGTGGTPDPGEPTLLPVGFNGSGDYIIDAVNLDPAKAYDLTRGIDLLTFPDFVDIQVFGVSSFQFTDEAPPAGKAFYRLEEVE